MPEMLSLRTFRLASLSGHVVQFEANTPRRVPEEAVAEAMAKGCVPVDQADIPFYEDLTRSKVDFQGDLRKSLIFLAAQAVAKENNVKNFDGGGIPRASVISERLGYDVTAKEVLPVYQLLLQVKNGESEFVVHAKAEHVMRVVEASERAELLLLADEFGIDEKKAKGLQSRELRKLLLTKLNGAALG